LFVPYYHRHIQKSYLIKLQVLVDFRSTGVGAGQLVGAQDCNWRVGSPTGSCAYAQYAQSSCGAAASNVSLWMGVTTSCSTFPASTFSFYQTIGSAISVSGNAFLYIAYDDTVVIRLNGVSVFSRTSIISSISTQPWMFFQLVTLPTLSSVSDNILEVRVTNTAGGGGFNVYCPANFTAASEVTLALKPKANNIY
jgi:hypothetical protein